MTPGRPLLAEFTERRASLRLQTACVSCISTLLLLFTAASATEPTKSSASGEDSTRIELWVYDEIRAAGSEHQPVRFLGWDGVDESSDLDAWWGVFISDSTGNASGEFVHCDIRNAALGLQSRERLTVRHCLFENCESFGLSVATDSLVVESTTIRGAEYGINASEGTRLNLSNSMIEDCSLYGVAVRGVQRRGYRDGV